MMTFTKYGNIKSLEGIEAFKNLRFLDCSRNDLTSLDVTNNSALKILDCWGNQLTSLNVSSCTALTGLSCKINRFTTLDVSNNTKLEYLHYCKGEIEKTCFDCCGK